MSQPAPRPDVDELRPAQVLEALFFAPIGLGARLIAEAPDRYRQLRSDLVAARFLGEMAVTQGAAQLRARREPDTPNRSGSGGITTAATGQTPPTDAALAPHDDVETQRGQPAGIDTDPETQRDQPAGVDTDPETPATADVEGEAGEDVDVDVQDLAIPDYDTVPAIDVVGQLADLDGAERRLIRHYELAHRARRTILGKLDQLEDSG